MIESYLIGSVGQSLERIRQLRQIVQGPYRREYDGLRQICLTRLDAVQAAFQCLAEETVVDTALQTPRRVREFTRIVEQLEAVENVGAFALSEHFRDEIAAADRLPKSEAKLYQLQLWHTCWVKFWIREFFCDLFGVLTTGPAFAWSHYHLCVKRGGDPFETPLRFVSTHPADDARMRTVLMMLAATGFDEAVKRIEKAWRDFVEVMGYDLEPEYRQCYPEALLSEIVSAAKEGVKESGVVTAKPDSQTPIVSILNAAWREFWRAPVEYQAWEAAQLDTLHTATGNWPIPQDDGDYGFQ